MQPEDSQSSSDQDQPLQHLEDTAPQKSIWPDRRQERRRPVDALTHLMRKSRVIFDDAGQDTQVCRILDASDNGYRISLAHPRTIDIGTGTTLEHADGSRMHVLVRWTSGNEVGLEIDWTYSRIILDAEEKEVHVCKFLAASEYVYRIEFNLPQKLKPGNQIILETANGARHQVRVQWIWENELGLRILGERC